PCRAPCGRAQWCRAPAASIFGTLSRLWQPQFPEIAPTAPAALLVVAPLLLGPRTRGARPLAAPGGDARSSLCRLVLRAPSVRLRDPDGQRSRRCPAQDRRKR